MSWVSENKFLAGFGAVMLVGVGTLGWLTYSAMDKYDGAASAYDTAAAQLKKLQETKPGLKEANLKELLAQKQELTEKISTFQQELKSRVLPTETITKVAFQDKLKETVAQITAKAAAAGVERPKEFYLGFGEYQSRPPDDKATPALARELKAIEMVMSALIKTGHIDLEEFQREPLPEEGGSSSGKRRGGGGGGGSDRGMIERNGLRLKFTSDDQALRKVLTELANHKQQLFVIRNVKVENKAQDSPQRGPVNAPATPPPAPEGGAAAGTPAPAPAAPAPSAPAPAAPAGNEAGLAYVFGTEKITSTIDLEILNIEEPKAASEKPEKEKGSKKKEK
jgi:hypothetical protein